MTDPVITPYGVIVTDDLFITPQGIRPRWARLPLRSRQELYRLGAAQGWSRGQVRRAYATGQNIGATRYQQTRARNIASGRIRPSRSYQQFAPRTRRRIDRLIEQRQSTEGISRREALRDIQEGRWRPTAQKAYERVPQAVRNQVANRGYDASQDGPIVRAKREAAIDEAYAFAARQAAEGNTSANGQTLAARLSMASEAQLDLWLTADDDYRIELARAQYTPTIDEATLQSERRTNPVTGEVEYYHPVTGNRTDLTYVHDNTFWYH
jgi:hypothetical protein